MIEIQNGCIKHHTKPNTWIYSYVDLEAHQDYQDPLEVTYNDYVIEFTAPAGIEPKIGDFIDNGIWIPRTTPKVNNDWRMWKDKEL